MEALSTWRKDYGYTSGAFKASTAIHYVIISSKPRMSSSYIPLTTYQARGRRCPLRNYTGQATTLAE